MKRLLRAIRDAWDSYGEFMWLGCLAGIAVGAWLSLAGCG